MRKVTGRLSSRLRFFLAVTLLLLAASLRLFEFTTLPPGLSDAEITEVQIIETVRAGEISVFYDLGNEGREGLYHILQALVSAFAGNGPLGYRMLSVWVNLIALALVYAVGRRLYGSVGGLAAMALLTVSFYPILLSRQISQTVMFPFLVSVALLTLVTALPVYRRRRKSGDITTTTTALGFFLAVGLYIHPIGLLILLFSAVFIGYMIRSDQPMSRRRISYIAFAVLLMVILSMPYVISSVRTPRLGGVERLTGDELTITIDSVLAAVQGLVTEGDSNPINNLPGRPLLDPFSVGIIVIGLLTTVIGWRKPKNTLLIIALLILTPVFLFSSQAPNFANYAASLPLLALLFGTGLSAINTRVGRLGTPLIAVMILGILGFNLVALQEDLYTTWPQDDAVQTAYNGRIGALAQHVDLSSDDISTVICGWQPNTLPDRITDAQKLTLMLNRTNGDLRYVNCRNALIMTDGGEPQQIIVPDQAQLETANPYVQSWLAHGEWLSDENLPPSGVLLLDVEEDLADRVGLFTVEAATTLPPEINTTAESIFPPISLSNNLTFLGYAPPLQTTFTPGDVVNVVTYWRIQEGVVPTDLQLFTHILADPAASPPANTDTIHVDTRRLQSRDVFIHATQVPLPDSLPPGTYTVSIGAYQNTSDIRLDVLLDGEISGNRLFIYEITVEEPA